MDFDLDQLRATLGGLQSSIDTLQTSVQEQHTQISSLQGQLQSIHREQQVQADLLRAHSQLLAQVQPRPLQRPKPLLPDPEKFAGTSVKFDTWLATIRSKLSIDALALGDAEAQFSYVFMNLDSRVQAMVLPQLAHAQSSCEFDYNTILDQLARVFDNPNKVQEAEDRLLNLRQDTDSVAAFVAKFERVLYEAQGQDWPDVTKISTFRKGLNNNIRNRLNQQLNLPRTYTEFIRTVQQLASYTGSSHTSGNPSGMSNSTKPGNGRGTGNGHTSGGGGNGNGDKMDIGSLEWDEDE